MGQDSNDLDAGERDKVKADAGRAGGLARRRQLSAERRKEIASRGARARWHGEGVAPVRATHAGVIQLGDLQLPCANLPDGRRVVSEGAMLAALGRGYSGWYSERDASAGDPAVPPRYLAPRVLKPFISEDLANLQIIPYSSPQGGVVAKGLNAEAVPQICDIWLNARAAGVLNEAQLRTASKAELLMRGLARVGIAALIDEATGAQAERERDALAKILEAFIAQELRPWVSTFPPDFYREMYRLWGWQYPPTSNRHNSIVGKLTVDIVYQRLAPGVREELNRITPRSETGRLKHKWHQRLSENLGYQKLKEHLHAVVVLMRASDSKTAFMRSLDRALPPYPDIDPDAPRLPGIDEQP